MIGKFFHTPAANGFAFRPRFYDPDKEERDDRVTRIKGEMGIVEEKIDDGKPFVSNLKGQFRDGDKWMVKSLPGARKSQNRRLITLVLILALVFYMLLFR